MPPCSRSFSPRTGSSRAATSATTAAREVAIDWTELRDVESFLREHTQPEDVIASSHPERFFLSTGRRGHYFWPVTDPVALDYDPERAASRFTILPAPAEARARSQEVMRRLGRGVPRRRRSPGTSTGPRSNPPGRSRAWRGRAPGRLRAAPHHPRQAPSRSIGSGFPRARLSEAELDLRALRIDHHARRRREPEPAPVGAASAAQIEAVAVPRTAQAAVLERRVFQRTQPVGALGRMGEAARRRARPRGTRGRRARTFTGRRARSAASGPSESEPGGAAARPRREPRLAPRHHRFVLIPEPRVELEVGAPERVPRAGWTPGSRNSTSICVRSGADGASRVQISVPQPGPASVRAT